MPWGFPFGRVYRSNKPQKAKKPNWFSELNATQVKELAKACNLKVSGSKGDLIARLFDHKPSLVFSCNKQGYSKTLDHCKQMCRERSLQVGGTKYDLILRILHSDHGTGGDSLKRAATVMVIGEDGVRVAKKRKTAAAPKPNPNTFFTRMQQKIRSSSQKKYQSYRGSKSHGPAVARLMEDLFYQASSVVATEPRLAYDCFAAIFQSFSRNFEDISRPRYCDGLSSLVDRLYDHFQESFNKMLDDNKVEKACAWLTRFEVVCSPYGLLCDCNSGRDIPAIVRMLRGEEEDVNDDDEQPNSQTAETSVSVVSPANEAKVAPPVRDEIGAPNVDVATPLKS